MTIYFGFALADSMFPATCDLKRRPLMVDDVYEILIQNDVQFCFNPSHEATVKAAAERFELPIPIQIPATPPVVKLTSGDKLVVMSVRGLPRLTDRRHYSEEEIRSATFEFAEWSVS